VLRSPRQFFTNGVAPGDQAPGLAFAVVVAVVYVAGLLAVQPELILGTSVVPILGGSTGVTMLLVLLVTAVVAAPAGLHLIAAIQTVFHAIVAANHSAPTSPRRRQPKAASSAVSAPAATSTAPTASSASTIPRSDPVHCNE